MTGRAVMDLVVGVWVVVAMAEVARIHCLWRGICARENSEEEKRVQWRERDRCTSDHTSNRCSDSDAMWYWPHPTRMPGTRASH